jgi:hypothetical protein
MKKEKIIISGFIGFAMGVTVMSFIQFDKSLNNELYNFERNQVIRENINTCEDIIEWMEQDVENYSDSTVFDSYIWNLEDMAEDNRNLLK